METDSQRLVKLLEDSIELYKKDRQMAIDNYNMLQTQLKQITTYTEMSDEGVLEGHLNRALEAVFKSGQRLDNVIQSLTKILIGNMQASSRVEAAKAFSGMLNNGQGNEKVITSAVDISKLLDEPE